MDNQPIDTKVKDYSGKSMNTTKVGIILTIVFFIVIGLMIYSLYPKFKTIHFMGNGSKDYDIVDTTSTTVAVNDSIDVEEIKSEDFLIYKLTNKTGSTKDIIFRLNTYVKDEVENTISREVTSISNNYSTYVYIPVSELKIYDKYDYTINSTASFYHTALDGSIKESVSDYNNDHIFTNVSERIVNLSVVVVYYEGNVIKDVKTLTKTQLDKNCEFTVNIYDKYDYFEVHLVEAYSLN